MVYVVDVQVGVRAPDKFVEGFAGCFVDRHAHELVEHGGEFAEGFKRRARAGKFFVVQRQRAVVFVDGHDALVEVTVLDSVMSALLAFGADGVDVFTRNAFEGRDHVRANALVGLGMKAAKVQVARVEGVVPAGLHGAARVRHHLDPTGHAEIVHAAHNICCGKIHGSNS